MRCGWRTVGSDASPLSMFASSHNTWLASEPDLEALRDQAARVLTRVDPDYDVQPLLHAGGGDAAQEQPRLRGPAKGLERQAKGDGSRRQGATTWKSWVPLREALEHVAEAELDAAASHLSPLWFCYASAQQRSEQDS